MNPAWWLVDFLRKSALTTLIFISLKYTTVQVCFVFATEKGGHTITLDAKNAFLNAIQTEKLYKEQTEGYIKAVGSHKICLFQKSAYCLEQASRILREYIHYFLLHVSFSETRADLSLYISSLNDSVLLLLVYV